MRILIIICILIQTIGLSQNNFGIGLGFGLKSIPLAVTPKINIRYERVFTFCFAELPFYHTYSMNYGMEVDFLKLKNTNNFEENFLFGNVYYSNRKTNDFSDFDDVENEGWKIKINRIQYLNCSLGIKSYGNNWKKKMKLPKIYPDYLTFYVGYKYALTKNDINIIDPGIEEKTMEHFFRKNGSYPYIGFDFMFATNIFEK